MAFPFKESKPLTLKKYYEQEEVVDGTGRAKINSLERVVDIAVRQPVCSFSEEGLLYIYETAYKILSGEIRDGPSVEGHYIS